MDDHILAYEAAWNCLVQKLSSVNDTDKKYLRDLKMCMEDLELKAQFPLRTCCHTSTVLYENLS